MGGDIKKHQKRFKSVFNIGLLILIILVLAQNLYAACASYDLIGNCAQTTTIDSNILTPITIKSGWNLISLRSPSKYIESNTPILVYEYIDITAWKKKIDEDFREWKIYWIYAAEDGIIKFNPIGLPATSVAIKNGFNFISVPKEIELNQLLYTFYGTRHLLSQAIKNNLLGSEFYFWDNVEKKWGSLPIIDANGDLNGNIKLLVNQGYALKANLFDLSGIQDGILDFDTDKDQIPDSWDDCLDTVIGASVNARGCTVILSSEAVTFLPCNNGIKDSNEQGIDCGGVCPAPCPEACPTGKTLCGDSCIDTNSDIGNCGTCGNVCTVANGIASCSNAVCGIESCNTESNQYDNCDNNIINGCETNLLTAADNCGACGNKCTAEEKCLNGECKSIKMLDGEPCISSLTTKTSDTCKGGYCIHGYCRPSETYCGDGFCDFNQNRDLNEDSNNCAPDCLNAVSPVTYKFDYEGAFQLWNAITVKKYGTAFAKYENDAGVLSGCSTEEPDSALEKRFELPSNAKTIKIRFKKWAVNGGKLIVTVNNEVVS